jgi:hypothetical protein
MLRLTYQATRGLRRFRWADLLANIASMFVDVLPPLGERYIVDEGRSHTISLAAGTISAVAPD